jgi:hypothetical protein
MNPEGDEVDDAQAQHRRNVYNCLCWADPKPIPLLPSENATLIITIPNTVNPAPRNIL